MPQVFGKYILLRRLAVGGMAEIFLAKSTGAEGFQRDVVIKRILPSYSEDEAFISMFIDEARIAARLHHANIVQIFDFDRIDDSYYIAMEFIDGQDLRKILDRGKQFGKPMTPIRVAHTVADIAAGLRYAHSIRGDDGQPLNLVHRDISPHNVLISFSGEVKVTDFGIAKAAARSTKTRAGTVKGKCSYMSPEQARGRPLDGRSDCFALCAVGWEMLTGRKLYDGETDFEILGKVIAEDAAPPSSLNKTVQPELDAILLKGLERDLDRRWANMGELERALREFEFKHARSLEEVALSPYLHELFAEEIKASDTSVTGSAVGSMDIRTPSQVPEHAQTRSPEPTPARTPVAGKEMGTLVLSDEMDIPRPAAGPASVAGPIPAQVTPSAPGELPSTIPVGDLQQQVEAHLAAQAAGIPGKDAPRPVPIPVETTPRKVTPVATPPVGTASQAVADQDDVSTLSLTADEADRMIAARSGAAAPAPYPVPSAAASTGRKRPVWLMPALGIAGLIVIGVVAGVLFSGGDETPGQAQAGSVAVQSVPAPPVQAPEPVAPPPPVPAPEPVAAKPVPEPEPPAPVPPAQPSVPSAVLALRVTPPEAVVRLDGEEVPGQRDRTTNAGKLRVGDEVRIEASAPGHRDWAESVQVKQEHQEVAIRLTPVPVRPAAPQVDRGSVTINARPWADVYLKGRKIGTTPIRGRALDVGEHAFVLRKDDVTRNLTVTIEKGKTSTHFVDMSN
jgi:serine/threonine-protein kinase